MHRLITNSHFVAFDAYARHFRIRLCLALMNEYSGPAASPALYNAFAQRKLACP